MQPMDLKPHISLNLPLHFPVRLRNVDSVPKILAGGIPVLPINLILSQRRRETGATPASLDTYARAARLYVEFCAAREQSLCGISNEEFIWFQRALLGDAFPDALGHLVHLEGKRQRRTADLMLTLLYSLAADIAARYDITFDWLRYKGVSPAIPHAAHYRTSTRGFRSFGLRRVHSIRWVPPKIMGLPDAEFVRLLCVARERWEHTIADGDAAFAPDPEAQRGALFSRNIAILFVLRYAGSRRSEAVEIEFDDIDRAVSTLSLTTKGHRREAGERLPVLLFPWVRDVLWSYATHFRPCLEASSAEDRHALFLSHSTQNYGHKISDESVRMLIDTLRPALHSPWNTCLTPHMLRHSFGYDLQKYSGPTAVTTNMRHASSRSSEPYTAGPETFAEELLLPGNARIEHLLSQAGLLEVLRR